MVLMNLSHAQMAAVASKGAPAGTPVTKNMQQRMMQFMQQQQPKNNNSMSLSAASIAADDETQNSPQGKPTAFIYTCLGTRK